MKINDEGTSNAAYWYERAMKAEARLAEEESAHRVTAGIFASTLVRADAAEARLAEAEARLEEATDLLGFAEARLLAFGQHNSSNPDYVLAMDAIKLFLMTADSAPAVTDNCPLCGEPRADHAEIAPNGKPECRMKCKRCGDTGWLQGDPILGISDEPCGCDENWEE